jgi:polysaccharide export outer membrane protein
MKLHTSRQSLTCFFLMTGFVLLTAALAAAQPPPAAETPQPEQKPVEKPATVTGGAAVDTKTFKVGPEDVLKVGVWGDNNFSGMYTIHTDGAITLPLVGDLQVGGLTPVEIEPLITKALSKYIVKPLVTVTVQAVYSRRYYIDGEAARAGEFSLQGPTTVLDALSRAGGFRDFANLKKIYILRGEKRIPFNYKEVIHGKNLSQNILLEPGDHIVVP